MIEIFNLRLNHPRKDFFIFDSYYLTFSTEKVFNFLPQRLLITIFILGFK